MGWFSKPELDPAFEVPRYVLEPAQSGGYFIRVHDGYRADLLHAGFFSGEVFVRVFSEKEGREVSEKHTYKLYARWLRAKEFSKRKSIDLGRVP